MSTKVADRKDSAMQFIETAKNLAAHTLHYSHKLPKSTRFTIQIRLCDLSLEIYQDVVCANAIFCRKDNEADKEKKRELLQNALGLLNSLEGILSIIMIDHKQDVTDYGWEQWGELILEERKLLTGLLKTI